MAIPKFQTRVFSRLDNNPQYKFLPESIFITTWLGKPVVCLALIAFDHNKPGAIAMVDLHRKELIEVFPMDDFVGFVKPTNEPEVVVAGVGLNVILLNLSTGEQKHIGTVPGNRRHIINDAGIFNHPKLPASALFVGTKCLVWEGERDACVTLIPPNGSLQTVKTDMFCSNMNFTMGSDDSPYLVSAETSKGLIVRHDIAVSDTGEIQVDGEGSVFLDISGVANRFPDGGRPLKNGDMAYAVFNVRENAHRGEACIVGPAGAPVARFITEGSPKATNICPVVLNDKVHFLISTACETTDGDWLKANPNAGCIFISQETPISPAQVLPEPVFSWLS